MTVKEWWRTPPITFGWVTCLAYAFFRYGMASPDDRALGFALFVGSAAAFASITYELGELREQIRRINER
jgi:hypothetical protein